MCLPVKSDQPGSSSAPPTRSIFGLGALMLLACLAGAGGVALAIALCVAIPAGALAWRRRATRLSPGG